MSIISLRQLLDHAAENNYGVPAFNVNNLGGLVGVYSFDSAAPDLHIRDSRGILETYVAGNGHGGLVGSIQCVGTCSSGGLVIERSINDCKNCF